MCEFLQNFSSTLKTLISSRNDLCMPFEGAENKYAVRRLAYQNIFKLVLQPPFNVIIIFTLLSNVSSNF